MITCTPLSPSHCQWLQRGTLDTCNFDVPISTNIQNGTNGFNCTAVAPPAPPKLNLTNKCYTRALPLQKPVFAISSVLASSRVGSSQAVSLTWSPLWFPPTVSGELGFTGPGHSRSWHLAAPPAPFAHIRPFLDSITHSWTYSIKLNRITWVMRASYRKIAQLPQRKRIMYTWR